MNKILVAALLAAVTTGLAIGAQGGLVRLATRGVGAARVGMLVNVAGGAFSLVALLALAAAGAGRDVGPAIAAWPAWVSAGVLGTGILIGMAFTLPRVGIAAGLGGVILGQLAAAVLIDTLGWGAPRIPLTAARLAGLTAILVGVLLVLPRR